jgi:hypothetical protein
MAKIDAFFKLMHEQGPPTSTWFPGSRRRCES